MNKQNAIRSRTGASALEALADGSITDEERVWLEKRAASSKEWADAVEAHRPPTEAEKESQIEALFPQPPAVNVIPFPRRRIQIAGAALAMAASVAVVVSLDYRQSLPQYSVSRQFDNVCSELKTMKSAAEPCTQFVVRPNTSTSSRPEVLVFDTASGRPLNPMHVTRSDSGVISIFLVPEDVDKDLLFVVGEFNPDAMTLAEARSPSNDWSVLTISK